MNLMLALDLSGKRVLDMGCGTGILAILASKKGAESITAIDIDEWAYKNTLENVEINNAKNIIVKQGDVELIKNDKFDVIVANINRNILLRDMPNYKQSLNDGGILMLSGFYTQDFVDIKNRAEQLDFKYEKHIEKDNWVSIKLIK
jgi:ribosomal protein L11 methyltransferase